MLSFKNILAVICTNAVSAVLCIVKSNVRYIYLVALSHTLYYFHFFSPDFNTADTLLGKCEQHQSMSLRTVYF